MGVRSALSRGPYRPRGCSPGQPRRTDPSSGRGHWSVLLPDGRGHHAGRGSRDSSYRWAHVCPGIPDTRRRRFDQRICQRQDGKPGVPQDSSQLRTVDGNRCDDYRRRSHDARRRGSAGPRNRGDPVHLRTAGIDPRRSGGTRRGSCRMTMSTRPRQFREREPLSRSEMAQRVAADIPSGSFVNLGIGLPTEVSDYLDPGAGVVLHTENGMLGMGPAATGDQIDPDLTHSGKKPVTELPGAAYFHHADSFAMMRGGHLDVCVMGAFQVSYHGDLANWHTGAPDAIPAVGGAMDLAIGAKRVFVMMNLFAKDGSAKLVADCTYPLTGWRCVSRVYTARALFEIALDGSGVRILETFGSTAAEISSACGI